MPITEIRAGAFWLFASSHARTSACSAASSTAFHTQDRDTQTSSISM